ncbi:RapZ C-terminal domain-containing protein [Embleya sp. MST-111070]|uniref:RapZ C-terminal domain-containing protein n=1 Tax=Embleya sp. MST-111070 TaxID=3398231 RepID=UPI003F73B036
MSLVQVLITTVGTGHDDAIDRIGPGLYYHLGHLRDPHVDPAMRRRTGLDATVRDHVLRTPGAAATVTRIVDETIALVRVAEVRRRLVRITLACIGGRHRSVVVAECVAERLRATGVEVEVDHAHIDRPILAPTT